MKILKVTVKSEVDIYADISFLGKFTDTFTEGAIERGDVGHGQYRYFVPAISGEESDNPDSPMLDYKRAEAFESGEWHMRGVTACAEVQLTQSGPVQKITSGGLWGVESDSGEDYFREVGAEQLSDLRGQLLACGFTPQQIETAIKSAKRGEG